MIINHLKEHSDILVMRDDKGNTMVVVKCDDHFNRALLGLLFTG